MGSIGGWWVYEKEWQNICWFLTDYVLAEENIEGLIKMLYGIGKLWGIAYPCDVREEDWEDGSFSELVDMLDTVELNQIMVYNHFILTRDEWKRFFIGWT